MAQILNFLCMIPCKLLKIFDKVLNFISALSNIFKRAMLLQKRCRKIVFVNCDTFAHYVEFLYYFLIKVLLTHFIL